MSCLGSHILILMPACVIIVIRNQVDTAEQVLEEVTHVAWYTMDITQILKRNNTNQSN